MSRVLIIVLLALATNGRLLIAQAPFPHDRHAKLFPNCEGCHGGIVTGRADRVLPNPRQCETCHNGTDSKRIQWTPRGRSGQRLLRFAHVEHAAKTDSIGRRCESCHADPDAPRMHVSELRAARCFSCHTHRASAHFDESNRCSTCHVPLTAATAMSAARVGQLPRPASHDDTTFVANHGTRDGGTLASCATCHARESCVRCHLNAATVPSIAALRRDARVAALVRDKAAVYPRPASHLASAFAFEHGPEANRDAARCAACHARLSCTTCHIGTGAARAINALPDEPTAPGAGRGVQLQRTRSAVPAAPPRRQGPVLPVRSAEPRKVLVHPAGFERTHAPAARSGRMTCEGCHAPTMCSSCHAGEGSRAYHPPNFSVRHAATAYSRETDCASCHNTEAFCRACHQTTGVGARANALVKFHTASSQWLLQHGNAARQSLSTCTTCHRQRDCMQCHSTLGWGVSPHGPGFDAARLWKQAKPMCLRCHLSDPTRS